MFLDQPPVQAAKHVVKHLACPSIPPCPHGVSMTELIIGGVAIVVAFALGWYIKGRGMAGVQTDLNNIKTDVENIKNKIFPTAPVGAGTPVASLSN